MGFSFPTAPEYERAGVVLSETPVFFGPFRAPFFILSPFFLLRLSSCFFLPSVLEAAWLRGFFSFFFLLPAHRLGRNGPPFRQSVRFASTLFCRRGPYTGQEQKAEGATGHDPWGNLSSLQHGALRLRLPAGRQAGGTASSPPVPMDAGGGAGRRRRRMRPFSPFSPVANASARRGGSLLRALRLAGLPALPDNDAGRSPALRRRAERPAAVGPARRGVGGYGGPLPAAVLAGGSGALVHDGGAAGGADRGRA